MSNTEVHIGDSIRRHFKFVTAHVWLSSFLIYVLLVFLCVCQFQNFFYYQKERSLSKENVKVQVDRITLCSARGTFGGRTSTGIFSGVNQVALSPDLQKRYKGWYAVLPKEISNEIFLVSDTMNERYTSGALDIYTYQPVEKAVEFGVKKGVVTFISREGIGLLGSRN